jgi:hypothetical protein
LETAAAKGWQPVLLLRMILYVIINLLARFDWRGYFQILPMSSKPAFFKFSRGITIPAVSAAVVH